MFSGAEGTQVNLPQETGGNPSPSALFWPPSSWGCVWGRARAPLLIVLSPLAQAQGLGWGGLLWGGQALFPALLFRDQKMVLWLSHGPTICDMLTA